MGYRDSDGVYKPDKWEKDYATWLVDKAKKDKEARDALKKLKGV